MTVSFGLANCVSCGAQIGTIFSETDFVPMGKPVQKRRIFGKETSQYEKIEKAKDQANNSLVMSLASFFLPLLGFLLVTLAIVNGSLGLRTLTLKQVEEGRGSAIAGLVISVLGLVAQVGYLIYFLKVISWTKAG